MSPVLSVHSSAFIDDGAQIGPGTKIWHFCHVSKGATIGNNCILGQNVFVSGNAKIGNNVKIQNNVSVYDNVCIEDDVFCGPSCVFTNVINPRSTVDRKKEFRTTHVKKGATIGANATIICGSTLGQYCLIGAGAVVTKNIPDFALVVGAPAKQIGWVNKAGNKLNLPITGDEIIPCPDSDDRYILRNDVLILEMAAK